MKTTVDIPDEMLRELLGYAGSGTKREAILAAIDECNRRRRMAKLTSVLGTFQGEGKARRAHRVLLEPWNGARRWTGGRRGAPSSKAAEAGWSRVSPFAGLVNAGVGSGG